MNILEEKDKQMHFCIGCIVYCVVFVPLAMVFDRVVAAAILGMIYACWAGLVKEKVDERFDDDDLLATVLGGLFGCLTTIWFWL